MNGSVMGLDDVLSGLEANGSLPLNKSVMQYSGMEAFGSWMVRDMLTIQPQNMPLICLRSGAGVVYLF
jgi:hypothetical protein